MPLGVTDVIFDVSTISSHVTTRLLESVFLCKCNLLGFHRCHDSLSHSQAHIPGFQAKPSSHTRPSFFLSHSHWHLSIPFLFWFQFSTIKFTSAFVWSMLYWCLWFIYSFYYIDWIFSNLHLPFSWIHLFYQMNSEKYYNFQHICLN